MFKALMFVVLAAFVAFGVTLYVATEQMAGRAPLVVPETVAAEAEGPATKRAPAGKRPGMKTAGRGGATGKKNVETASPLPVVAPKTPQPLDPPRFMN